MSPRGANFKRGTATRAEHDAKIRAGRHRYAVAPLPRQPAPEFAEPTENPDLHPTPVERRQAELAFRAIRRQQWEVPTIDSTGCLCPRPLPETMVLDWESVEHVTTEIPDYLGLGWQVEETEIGILVSGPGRLPQLIGPEEIVPVVIVDQRESDEPQPVPVPVPAPVKVEFVGGVALVGSPTEDEEPSA